MKRIFLLMVFIFILIGCAAVTTINTNPVGAILSVNGEKIGYTPYYYWDRGPAGTTTKIKLEKEGYKPIETVIAKEKLVPHRLLTFPCIIPLFWIYDYKENYFFDLEKIPDKTANKN